MSFCATCGQPRKGTAPFCVSCGARFADAGDAADQPAKPESGSAETRWDTRIEMPGGPGPSAAALEGRWMTPLGNGEQNGPAAASLSPKACRVAVP